MVAMVSYSWMRILLDGHWTCLQGWWWGIVGWSVYLVVWRPHVNAFVEMRPNGLFQLLPLLPLFFDIFWIGISCWFCSRLGLTGLYFRLFNHIFVLLVLFLVIQIKCGLLYGFLCMQTLPWGLWMLYSCRQHQLWTHVERLLCRSIKHH